MNQKQHQKEIVAQVCGQKQFLDFFLKAPRFVVTPLQYWSGQRKIVTKNQIIFRDNSGFEIYVETTFERKMYNNAESIFGEI